MQFDSKIRQRKKKKKKEIIKYGKKFNTNIFTI